MADDGFTIRDASLFDLPAIWRLEQRCFPRDAYDIVSLLGIALSPETLRVKAVGDRRLVGYAAGELRSRDRVGWIITIGVLPEYEGRGIGHTLLNHLEVEMGRQASRIKLTVRQSNARAISLYTYCGYRCVSTSSGYYHDGEDGLIMEKSLTLA